MADWRKLVGQRLSGLALDAAEKEDVHAELAAHLDDTFQALQNEGLPEEEAAQRTLAQVPDWQDLANRIALAKNGGGRMKKRVRQLWIPGFLALILSALVLTALQKLGLQPRLIWSSARPVLFYGAWLLLLPFFGALGAFLSFRAGGKRETMLFASVFPALALGTAFLLMSPIGMAIERVTGHSNEFGMVASALLKDGIGWLLIPGAALLLGGFLAQLLFGPRSSSQATAID